VLLGLVLAGCGSVPSSSPTEAREPAESAQQAGIEEPLPPEAVQRFDAAVVHMNAGDLAAAEQAFRALASTYPNYSGPLVNLGILAAKAGRFEEAEKTLISAVERNARNATAFNQLGIVYRKLGRFQDAEKAYEQAVQVDPSYATAYFNLGVLCDLYLQQPQRALEAYERYLELTPSPDSRVNAWVTELRKRVGDPSAAGG
jgi:tetratricopeptide (TPR) repeat protein